ncbi:hypothetical protein TsocGM_14950 [Tautonia sociabilis]|uniref:Uncharacterized protein n=2 Tax=Tautonia sociabilis TaxID=2080755 RepID=A0A432MI12_9BACT|nr:hypothetical protein TsocGM_14950 [Tautonia sociabilis]
MGQDSSGWSVLLDWFWSDPLRGLAALACVLALASTPVAFAVLGRREYLFTRRGRTYRPPEWWSVVCGMALVMGVPGIVLTLLVKSQYFDEDRYAFDPNTTWSVVEQGRQYRSAQELAEAAEREYSRLQEERRLLVEGVKKLDEAMIPLRAAAATFPPTAEALPGVLENLATIREAVGVDAPQQLLDETAPPIELARDSATAIPFPYPMAVPPGFNWPSAPGASPAPAVGPGLTPAEREAELAQVPAPQRDLAALLPLTNLPQGWEVGDSGGRSLETFNADNLYEKIDGRAESFVQYDVVGMAYTFYHPEGNPANEVQLYIFELSNPLNALGKYGTEKPEDAEPLQLGTAGYSSGASVFFHAKSYYVQIVPTSESDEFRAFALALARRISNDILPGSAPEPDSSASPAVAAADGRDGSEPPPSSTEEPAEAADPTALFALLPDGPGRSNEQYVAQDVFGYSFLSHVFMASYAEGDRSWQAFIRPYASPERAREVFDLYRAEAEAFDAKIQEVESESVDAMYVAENFGLIDVLFLRGNVFGGVNGATDLDAARAFAERFAGSLPAEVPHFDNTDSETETDTKAASDAEEGD